MTQIPLPDGFYDICWLDCPNPGNLLVDMGLAICLCAEHRRVLEEGKWGPSYVGAPLPSSSKASTWPWQRIRQAA